METLKKYFYENTKHKTQKLKLIFVFLLSMTACIDASEKELDLEFRVKQLSEKYGLKSEKVDYFEGSKNNAIHLEFIELESFLKYQKQSISGETEIDFSEVSEIFRKNNIPFNLLKEEIFVQKITDLPRNNGRILCFENSHNVRVRIPAMVLPGDDLNGVEISLGVGGGTLNAQSFGMYGFYPFLGVSSNIVNPEFGSSAYSNGTYGFLIDYTVSYNLFIDGTSFLNYATYSIKVRINGCTGEVSYYYAIP